MLQSMGSQTDMSWQPKKRHNVWHRYLFVCLHKCMCMHVYAHMCICVYVRVHKCMHMCMYMCICVYTCAHICIGMCMYMQVCACVRVCVCVHEHKALPTPVGNRYWPTPVTCVRTPMPGLWTGSSVCIPAAFLGGLAFVEEAKMLSHVWKQVKQILRLNSSHREQKLNTNVPAPMCRPAWDWGNRSHAVHAGGERGNLQLASACWHLTC